MLPHTCSSGDKSGDLDGQLRIPMASCMKNDEKSHSQEFGDTA
jgi:hypothetical protein